MIAEISMVFDVALAALLAVMIFYSVRLNKRIAMLRDGEGELQQMIAQFSESSLVAQESARKLKAAGTEAEFGVKAAVAKGMALRNDLEMMLDQAELLVDRLDDDRYRVTSAPAAARPAAQSNVPTSVPSNTRANNAPAGQPSDWDSDSATPDRSMIEREIAARAPQSSRNGPAPVGQTNVRDTNVKPFSPPIRSADEVVRAETGRAAPRGNNPGSENLEPRTEAERHLLDAIRAAKQGVA
jgi:hypothetical protein